MDTEKALEKKIIELYNRGFLVKEIAKKIGIPVGTTSGICARLAKNKRMLGRGSGFYISPIRFDYKDIKWPYKPLGKSVTILELTPQTCRFPCEDNDYCGAEVYSKGYCEEHYRLCWNMLIKRLR